MTRGHRQHGDSVTRRKHNEPPFATKQFARWRLGRLQEDGEHLLDSAPFTKDRSRDRPLTAPHVGRNTETSMCKHHSASACLELRTYDPEVLSFPASLSGGTERSSSGLQRGSWRGSHQLPDTSELASGQSASCCGKSSLHLLPLLSSSFE